MKTLILIIGLMSANANAKSVESRIIRNVQVAAKKYGVPELELFKIAYVESSFGINAKTRLNPNGTYDIGVFQVNSIHWYTTCKDYNIYKMSGNTMCAAKILAMHYKHKKKDIMWAARYHSKTPSLKAKYAKKLKKAGTVFAKKLEVNKSVLITDALK